MKLLKQRPFFVTAKGTGADQKAANKKLLFRKMVYGFLFFDRYCKRGWHAVQTSP